MRRNGQTQTEKLCWATSLLKRRLFPTPTKPCTDIHHFSVGLLYNTSVMIGVKARTGCAARSGILFPPARDACACVPTTLAERVFTRCGPPPSTLPTSVGPPSLPFSLSSCSPWPWLAAALVLIRAAHPFLTSRQLTRFQRGGGGGVTLFLHIPLMCLLTFPPCPRDALLSPMCCLIVGPRRSRVIRHCHKGSFCRRTLWPLLSFPC